MNDSKTSERPEGARPGAGRSVPSAVVRFANESESETLIIDRIDSWRVDRRNPAGVSTKIRLTTGATLIVDGDADALLSSAVDAWRHWCLRMGGRP
jgi:hypothetical protein